VFVKFRNTKRNRLDLWLGDVVECRQRGGDHAV
jgi:hypothetical protein